MLLLLLLSCTCRFEHPDSQVHDDTTVLPDDSPGDTQGDSRGDTQETGPIEPVEDVPVVLMSDNLAERVLVFLPATSEIVWELDVPDRFPELCTPPENTVACGVYDSEHSIDPTSGLDKVVYTFHAMDVDQPTKIGSRRSVIEQIIISEDGETTSDWQMFDLDFSVNFAGNTDLCASSVPCDAPADQGYDVWQACSMVMVHDIEILEESDREVMMWIADTINSRILKVRLDKSSTCGVVEDVVDKHTVEAWQHWTWVNDVDYVELEGRPHLLANHKGYNSDDEIYNGRSTLTLFGQYDDTWQLRWQHPNPREDQFGFLNASHNADWIEGADGEPYVIYAHSNGAGARWEDEAWGDDDDRGSLGMLRVASDGSAYRYLGDGVLPLHGDPIHFLRDVDLLDDGSFLLTDSGCKGDIDGCEHPSVVHHVAIDLTTLEEYPGDGGFSDDHRMQNLIELGALTEPESWQSPSACSLEAGYDGDLLWSSTLGPGLSAMIETASPCPQE